MPDDLLSMLAARKGHFLLESGHHGDLWLDLESLFLSPNRLRPFVVELANRLGKHDFDAVCGPLIGGAFVGQRVAEELGAEFYFTEACKGPRQDGLFPVKYRLPESLRGRVCGKRIAIVNDVINAGSAVRGTFADLESCGATIAAIGSMVVLGSSAERFAAEKNIAIEYVAAMTNPLWTPAECPLCAAGVPLDPIGGTEHNG